ncbi:Uncharacterized conserved protein, DUF1697 family [Actinacidiphila alni]|uniref:Uncharacterized conserved protein, DUF1697 family n=1 Tax=Actinacidiphila alni TaxID=380248 RepID=A0A1I2ED97_9ACTN|nr:Uncharacterized conserved protein, DUF1697 family [Actinacidiphila alni]
MPTASVTTVTTRAKTNTDTDTDTSTGKSTSYVALLRGINVGGKNKLPMQTLRDLLADLGATGVRTHLQSGNAVFTHEEADPLRLAADLEQRIADGTGLTVACLVRTGADLRRVMESNPFPMDGVNPSRFMVTFLSGPVPLDKLPSLDPAAYAPDEFRPGEREIYAHFPDGVRDSKLAPLFTDRRLGLTASTRNWNTVTKLVELSDGAT